MRFEKVSLEAFMKDLRKYGIKEGYLTAYKNIKIPERKTEFSAGYDMVTPIPFEIKPNEQVVIPSGIKCYFTSGEARKYHLKLYCRSSIGIKKNLILPNGTGVIDADYVDNPENEGDILIALKNIGSNYHHFEAGDRLIQCIFETHGITEDDNAKGERKGGVGSTNG